MLRLYTWNPPAVSLGRFQDWKTAVNEEACRQRGIDIVRRITGGRAVLHHHELTYSIVAPTDHQLFPGNLHGAYQVIAEGLLAGLRRLGINGEIVSRGGRYAGMVEKRPRASACFASPSWYEIVVQGSKIIGSAQRRVHGAFLQHGSILIKYDAFREAEVIPAMSATGSRVKRGGSQTAHADQHAITCIENELGRAVLIDEVKEAIAGGFSETLNIKFIPNNQ